MLLVNEVFETFQGEAQWTGTPSVFVRLQSCGVGCPWCDTKNTWQVHVDKQISVAAMFAKERDADTYAKMTAEQLALEIASRFVARHVVITGGEPALYDLTEFSDLLRASGYRVQLETSGTQPIRINDAAWVTVSPKIDMPGGFKVRADAMRRANEVKMPIGKASDVDKLDELLRDIGFVPELVWLQPLSQSEKATKTCVEIATARNWRISVQVHRYLGVR